LIPVSLVVILFEVNQSYNLSVGLSLLNMICEQLTGALSHVLPIMICVMTSKWVGDAMGKDGIYSVWIAMRRYPWLPPVHYRDKGQTGANLMKPLSEVIVIEDGVTTVGELKRLLSRYYFHGFPVIDKHREFVGYATRQELRAALGKKKLFAIPSSLHNSLFFLSEERLQIAESDFDRHKKCTFSQNRMRLAIDERVDLSSALESSIIQLRKEVPQELVVNMFQKLVH
jgi:chloride channel 3/4/5